MNRTIKIGLMTAIVALSARTALADATAFFGTNVTPNSRLVVGASAGVGVGPIGFEFEYASTSQDQTNGAPGLKTGMANLLVQTPLPLAGIQPYLTAGGGLYHETLGPHGHTSFGDNVGGGVKIKLIGPLRLRLDYRVFGLGSGALFSPAHRLYAGINLGF